MCEGSERQCLRQVFDLSIFGAVLDFLVFITFHAFRTLRTFITFLLQMNGYGWKIGGRETKTRVRKEIDK
jgi:hypothetical protein